MGLTEQDGFMVTPATDRFTGYAIGISGDHAYTHKGRGYIASGVATVNAGATYSLTLTTPATGYVHYRPALISSSASYIQARFVESPTSVSGGTTGTVSNRNRNSSRASGVVYKFGVTASGGATLAILTAGSGGAPTSRAGGMGSSEDEIVLKPDTVYQLLIDNPAGGANSNVVWDLFWYEEDAGV